MPSHSAGAALLQGFAAIVLWASLASLTALAGPIPPFQLAAVTFGLGTLVGLAWAAATRESLGGIVRLPPAALALGVFGLLGYHVPYFFALQTAPPLEANIINYLWPLLIVLFAGLLPAAKGGQALRWWHLGGAGLGFAGTLLAMLSSGAGAGGLGSGVGLGHAAALLAAVVWAVYSVASRLFQSVPSVGVVASCAATAVAALAIHLLIETPRWPAGPAQWLAVLAMGLGPVGLAFYLWDRAVKHGDLRLLGVASYATPLMSTALLAGLGLGQASGLLWLAVALVTLGALLAARDTFKRL